MNETEKLMQLLREKLGPLADILWQQALRSAHLGGVIMTAVGSALVLVIIIGWILYGIRRADGYDHSDFCFTMQMVTIICSLLAVFLLPMGIWQLNNLQLAAFRTLIG